MSNTEQTGRTPSEELRSAAEKLRGVAKKADPGPWRPGFEGAVWRSVDALLCESFDENDAQWIAMTHPGLAEPLAVWLDWAAIQADNHPLDLTYAGMPDFRWCLACQEDEPTCALATDRALAVARVINGGGA